MNDIEFLKQYIQKLTAQRDEVIKLVNAQIGMLNVMIQQAEQELTQLQSKENDVPT